MLFVLKLKHQLDMPPRQYAPEYDRREVSWDVAKVFARTSARSPRNVELLMQRYNVQTIDELLTVLPSRRRRTQPLKRLRHWLMRSNNLFPYEPVVRPALRRLMRSGKIPAKSMLIYRSKQPS